MCGERGEKKSIVILGKRKKILGVKQVVGRRRLLRGGK